jgi:hypothetical protein
MEIVATIANNINPQGWQESWTAKVWNIDLAAATAHVQAIVDRWNATLSEHEEPRKLLSVELQEIEDGDAFNMGFIAYRNGADIDENYWPEGCANHEHWADGWEEAQRLEQEDEE